MQLRHAVFALAGWYLPAAQAAHAFVSLVAAVTVGSPCFPGAQLSHEERPLAAWYWPAAQLAQRDAPSWAALCPGLQLLHEEALGALANCPRWHLKHGNIVGWANCPA